MKKVVGAAMALALVALAACTTTESATTDCLARPSVFSAIGRDHQQFPLGWHDFGPGTALDARGASWAIANPYPVSIQSTERDDLCMVGGVITSLLPHDTTLWAAWHQTSALTVKRPNFQALQTTIENVGDGARFSGSATNWSMRGVYMNRAHDDCVENDKMYSGVIDDSFFDGCYVFYSARGGPNGNGAENVVKVTNSLVRLETMPFTYNNSGPGHGPFWKLSANPDYGRSPQMVIRNTVFRADSAPYAGASLTMSRFDHDFDPATPPLEYMDPGDCSNNTMVWLGEGPFPGELPACFTVTTDPAVWDAAVADWTARRPAL